MQVWSTRSIHMEFKKSFFIVSLFFLTCFSFSKTSFANGGNQLSRKAACEKFVSKLTTGGWDTKLIVGGHRFGTLQAEEAYIAKLLEAIDRKKDQDLYFGALSDLIIDLQTGKLNFDETPSNGWFKDEIKGSANIIYEQVARPLQEKLFARLSRIVRKEFILNLSDKKSQEIWLFEPQDLFPSSKEEASRLLKNFHDVKIKNPLSTKEFALESWPMALGSGAIGAFFFYWSAKVLFLASSQQMGGRGYLNDAMTIPFEMAEKLGTVFAGGLLTAMGIATIGGGAIEIWESYKKKRHPIKDLKALARKMKAAVRNAPYYNSQNKRGNGLDGGSFRK